VGKGRGTYFWGAVGDLEKLTGSVGALCFAFIYSIGKVPEEWRRAVAMGGTMAGSNQGKGTEGKTLISCHAPCGSVLKRVGGSIFLPAPGNEHLHTG